MDRKSKQELIDIINEQDNHRKTLEKRLRDVVHAYKSLAKEKDALEATVKAFSLTSRQSEDVMNKKGKKTGGKSPDLLADPLGASNSDKNDTGNAVVVLADEQSDHCNNKACEERESTFERLQIQLETLRSSLSTVSEEKSKMEAAFQGDKKNMMQEHERKITDVSQRLSEVRDQFTAADEQLKQLKNHLRQQQRDREEEQANHSVMLKEIQQLLTVERIEKEELRAQLIERDQTSRAITEDKSLLYEEQIKTLSKDLECMSLRLKQSEKVALEPNPMLMELSQQMNEMKQQHADAISMERKRANDAEEKLQTFSRLEEKRIAELEMKLSELSVIVGNYDRMRQQDQVVILKLKEKLAQLDVENETLARQTSLSPPEVEDNKRVTELQDQVSKLKGILKLSVKKIEKSGEGGFNVSEIDELLRNDPTHKVCQAEYRQLKDEFEHYKLTVKSQLLTDSSKETGDVKDLQQNVIDLQKELNELSRYIDSKEKESLQIISQLQCDLTDSEDKRKNDLKEAQEKYKLQLAAFDNQLKMQRDRTEQLLSEKDNDIKRLKERASSASGGSSPIKERGTPRIIDEHRPMDPIQEGELSPLFDRQLSGPLEGSLVHYTQLITKLEEELTELRKEKYELEFALRDTEHREEHVILQMGILKEEIRKLERDRSRESANMEYLKNIILRYILTDSASVKAQMTNALSMVLQLSPSEIVEIRKKQSGWWPG